MHLDALNLTLDAQSSKEMSGRVCEMIHDFLEGKSIDTNHNMIVPEDHAIILSKFSRYHSTYIKYLS
jgi:hypothetical protein